MKVNVQYAESHLADLISAASRGEVVEIEGEESTAQILAFPKPKLGGITGRRVLGAGRGEVRVPSIEEWNAMDKELLEVMMADSRNFQPVPEAIPLRGWLAV
jgi:antitoxin (DNA-binding transcriptional repressor) of toxin-antitoxin stability system